MNSIHVQKAMNPLKIMNINDYGGYTYNDDYSYSQYNGDDNYNYDNYDDSGFNWGNDGW